MSDWGREVRFGLRILKRDRAFSFVAISVLALGIGGISAIFTLVNTLALRPMKIAEPERLVGLYSKHQVRADSYQAWSYPNYADLREEAPRAGFASIAAHNLAMVGVGDGAPQAGSVRRVFADVVSANYFDTLGVPLALGRPFSAAEEAPGSGQPVAILSWGHWQRLGGRPEILGSTIRVNTRALTVVGVTAKGFTGRSALLSPELYLPLGLYESVINDFDGPKRPLGDRGNHVLMLLGRLADGTERDAAEARLGEVVAALRTEHPAELADQTAAVAPLSRMSISTSPSRDTGINVASMVLLAMAAIVLAISCLNLANMLLARGTARRKEFAVRIAIGGGRGQIVRQLLVEGLVLSVIGGAIGAALAYLGNRLLIASMKSVIPIAFDFPLTPDLRTVVALFGFCLLATLIFGLGPALQVARAGVVAGLKDAGGAATHGARWRRALQPRNLLVIGQLALSTLLLVAAGLFVRGAQNAAEPDLGFPIAGTLLAETDASLAGFDEASARATYLRALERLRALPGAEAASLSATVPFGMVSLGERVGKPGELAPIGDKEEQRGRGAGLNVVGSDYFASLGVELVAGRAFTRSEEESSETPRVAIVDKALAEALWPGASAIGQPIALADDPTTAWEVVGVAPTVRTHLFDDPSGAIYLPFGRRFQSNVHFQLRAAGGTREATEALAASVRKELAAIDARLPILGLQTLERQLATSIELWILKVAGRLFALFGALALFIAAVGAYGLRAYAVGQRTREIGLRMALGATPRSTLRLVFREGLSLGGYGLGIGLLLSLAAARGLTSLLYEVSALDPVVFTLTPLVLLAVVSFACFVPALRASRVAPMVALRDE